ncbi:MAG: type IX secretion system membrane protein PorP/SprF [Flavobacteriales bacterium]
MKRIFFYSVLVFTTMVQAQQDPHFTQYFDNFLHVNPAYAGSSGMLSATAIHREQWVGFSGAPRSTTFSLHTPLNYKSVGLGLTAVNDMIGPVRQNMVYVDFSYTLKLGDKARLALGLKGGMNMLNVGTGDFVNVQQNDPAFQNVTNQINPNVGFGVYYHDEHFFLGLSSPRILENSGSTPNAYREQRHYFGIVGGVFPVSNQWKLRPSVQAKATTGAPFSLDISLAGIYADKLWLGAMNRWNAAVGGFAQYQINRQLRVGLAAEYGMTALRNYNNGTFEVLLSYDFNYKKSDVKSPRYF